VSATLSAAAAKEPVRATARNVFSIRMVGIGVTQGKFKCQKESLIFPDALRRT
jgi:hypothetical protein